MELDGLLQKGFGTENFSCYILNTNNGNSGIPEIIPKISRLNPLSCIIVVSFQEVSGDLYKKYIRLGANDVFELKENGNEKELMQMLLTVMNARWRIYRQIEIERKKTYQATIVTAHHEINQPLTVILNSLGLLNMELQKGVSGRASAERYIDFIMRSARRIQDILIQFKKIDHPRLIDYTANVPMIQIRDENSDAPKEEQTSAPEKMVLLYDPVLSYRQLEASVLTQSGFSPLLAESRDDAIRLARMYANRLHAAIVGVEEQTTDIQDLIFELKVHTLKLPVFLCTDEAGQEKSQALLKDGAHGILKRPFSSNQFNELLEVSYHAISF